MKIRFLLWLTLILSISAVSGQTDKLLAAKEKAKSDGKAILIKFSGSDWCVPCIQLQKRVFEDSLFLSFAEKNLVIIYADFPRQKKNRLSAAEEQDNEKLAEQFNNEGEFPSMVLLSNDGTILKKWHGFEKNHTSQVYIDEIKPFINH